MQKRGDLMTYINNPHADEADTNSIIEGDRLTMGDKVRKTDRYASTDGTWKAPGQSVGITIETPNVIWVRPTVKPDPKQPRLLYSGAVAAK
jgi:hypothetical protein